MVIKMKLYINLIVTFILLACSNDSQTISTDSKAQSIVDKAIKAHGGKLYERLELSFEFRDKKYQAKIDGNQFVYERLVKDSTGNIRDIYTYKNIKRLVNDTPYPLSEKEIKNFSQSINSVLYFALLPYKLNDPAVIKQYMGEVEIKGSRYHKVYVTFKKEGGGTDHQDEFIYWFNTKNYKMDYLAYNFHVNGGGTRFRVAYNTRIINGITFQDYLNYAGDKEPKPIHDMDQRFLKGDLKLLSKIELKNISVKSN